MLTLWGPPCPPACTSPQVFDIPFNSANKWAVAVTTIPGDPTHHLVMMKGAPEIVLTKCSHHLHNKEEKPINDVSGRKRVVVLRRDCTR